MLDKAEREWREHLETGFAVSYGDGPEIGTASQDPFQPGWRQREGELKAAVDEAREAWLQPVRPTLAAKIGYVDNQGHEDNKARE